jgi:hypothetical protein
MPLFSEVSLLSQESDQSSICVLGICEFILTPFHVVKFVFHFITQNDFFFLFLNGAPVFTPCHIKLYLIRLAMIRNQTHNWVGDRHWLCRYHTTTSIISPRFIELRQESEQPYICVLGISIFPLSTIFQLVSGTVMVFFFSSFYYLISILCLVIITRYIYLTSNNLVLYFQLPLF